jgi:hypothetical protein
MCLLCEHLVCKCEALSSKPQFQQKKRKKTLATQQVSENTDGCCAVTEMSQHSS